MGVSKLHSLGFDIRIVLAFLGLLPAPAVADGLHRQAYATMLDELEVLCQNGSGGQRRSLYGRAWR